MFSKKSIFLVLILALVFVMVAGCAPEAAVEVAAPTAEVEVKAETEVDSEPEVEVVPEPEEARESITITYLAGQDWIKDAELELAKMFEEETGIHIDYQIVPADQYFNVLTTKLNAGEGPDIFGGQSGKSDIKLQLNVEVNAVPLTDEGWVARMNPLSVDQVSLDGVVYGLTIWDTLGGTWVIVYNKDIFAEFNLNIPTTYAEFSALNQTLLEAGINPIYEPIADGWHHVLWFPEIGPAYEAASPGLTESLNANETTFSDNPTMLQALT
jgi:raffinose/stachyose/melibiose transport system substrate-binding protein